MSNLSFDFSGRTVIVTGAGRGIGLAIASAFAASRAQVVIVDQDEEVLIPAARELGAVGMVADITDSTEVARVVSSTLERTARIDTLVNNAGILRDAVVWKMDDEAWESVLAVHLGGTFRFVRACVPHFRQQGFGRIINVTSYTGLRGNPGQANYSAAKAGLIGFTKTTAKELARFGITVNAISPNAATRMIAAIPAERRRQMEAEIPLGRFGEPEEMTAAVAFLASEEAGYITGEVLRVDGGMAM